jgi:eukaryotic-like serine/threonine-protein kinase
MQPSWLQSQVQRRTYSIGQRLIVGAIVGSTVGSILGLIVESSGGPVLEGLIFGLLGGLIFGLLWGLIFGLLGRLDPERNHIKLAELLKLKMRWSWLPVLALVSALIAVPSGGLVLGLIFGMVAGLGIVLMLGIYDGLSVEQIEAKTKPNQGIWLSGRSALSVGLVSGLIFFLLNLVTGLIWGLKNGGLVIGLFLGLGIGLGIGLNYGGLAFIRHFVLRFLLWRNGYIPGNYVRFLDYAAERIFLRKVGGGYIFIHRMLMEYFAALETEPGDQ